MNTKILELAKQAGFASVENWGAHLKDSQQKFAELIIQECINAANGELVENKLIKQEQYFVHRHYLQGNNDGIIDAVTAIKLFFDTEGSKASMPPEEESEESEDPFAWATFDGEGNWDLRVFEDNEGYRDKYISRNGVKYASWVIPLYESQVQNGRTDVLTDALQKIYDFQNSVDTVAKELQRLQKTEEEWAALSQDDGKAEREIERLKEKNDELAKELASLKQGTPEAPSSRLFEDTGALFTAQYRFLKWNRGLDEPLVKVASEYAAFNEVVKLYLEAVEDSKT